MRSLNRIFHRLCSDNSLGEETTKYVYRWLYSRAQYLHNISHNRCKSFYGIFHYLINQYHRHVPIEYLCGSSIFFNRLFMVNKHVLIPRRDSETLIHHVDEIFHKDLTKKSLLEIGTGSGCLSITLSRLFPHWQLLACDISASALRLARINGKVHRSHNIKFQYGNLFDREFLKYSSYDVIISNPPYISPEDIVHCDRGIFYEPSTALFVDSSIKFYQEIVDRALNGWLKNGGYLIFECSPFNVKQIEEILFEKFDSIRIVFDTNQVARVISGKKK